MSQRGRNSALTSIRTPLFGWGKGSALPIGHHNNLCWNHWLDGSLLLLDLTPMLELLVELLPALAVLLLLV
jgi:hypothetical protein